ncbi:mixed lineage kinase domain-like protein [Ornithorhynchus anatinus]|uniref:mixed lineage kinase domain-like protein n=1 Tax=Ornithorhynchus anatinus TaxID=9258 RepID=UPI0004546538|nr:mixed lineage kinase domain-like protein [Ornithorhynchus anatinus]
MEILGHILDLAQKIYDRCETVKCCQKQCRRLGDRILILKTPLERLRDLQEEDWSGELEYILNKLQGALEKAKSLIEQFSQKDIFQKFLSISSTEEDFALVNDHMSDAAEGLSLLLQTEQRQLIRETFRRETRQRQDRRDAKEDRAHWEELLKGNKEIKAEVQKVQNSMIHVESSMENLATDMKKILRLAEQSQQSSSPAAQEKIKEIKIEQLIKTPWVLRMENKYHMLYIGEYYKSPVSIKVFKDTQGTSPRAIRKIFNKEIETMKKFEYPNILRIYGICIDERGPQPRFLLVMEYCELGTLGELLEAKPDLTWEERVFLALGAARGLYRLHHSEEKTKLHGCITSAKFLVAKGYEVKLAGLELSQTESSISRNSKGEKAKETHASAYVSPQSLENLNHEYDIPAEIYSFGIVLWEIATGKIPFQGCSIQEIFQQVYKERYQEPVRGDCPQALKEITDQCRAYHPSERPSAEDIVDKLSALCDELNGVKSGLKKSKTQEASS